MLWLGALTPPVGAADGVLIKNLAFAPATITVARGTTLTWKNLDEIEHNVVSGPLQQPDGRFASANLATGQTFTFTFASPGTYPYFCALHDTLMPATVVVAD